MRLTSRPILPVCLFLVSFAVWAQQPEPVLRSPGGDQAAVSVSSEAAVRKVADASASTAIAYAVSSVADSGPGSLREAVAKANRDCEGDAVNCEIRFNIPPPVPDTGWFTIRLSSPLPPITATNLGLTGESQTAFTGNTNPGGPEIYLSGDALKEGNGLEVRSAGDFIVSGLVIGGFPENGILFDAAARSSARVGYGVTNNYIGTDPTGAVAVPNHLRGVAVFVDLDASQQRRFANLLIDSNLISGNGRSGVFIHSGIFIAVTNNRIGLKAAGDEPLPNGASGIYFGVLADFGCISQNVIANNAHFAIAIERPVRSVGNVLQPSVRHVEVGRNSIKGNRIYGIDIGLDLATPGGDGVVVARPILTSARYDPASNMTTIVGRHHASSALNPNVVDLYSNSALDPKGGGETWIGGVNSQVSTDAFAFAFMGNLLGKTITAMATETDLQGFVIQPSPLRAASVCQDPSSGFLRTTSEFSDPILVTER